MITRGSQKTSKSLGSSGSKKGTAQTPPEERARRLLSRKVDTTPRPDECSPVPGTQSISLPPLTLSRHGLSALPPVLDFWPTFSSVLHPPPPRVFWGVWRGLVIFGWEKSLACRKRGGGLAHSPVPLPFRHNFSRASDLLFGRVSDPYAT